MPHSNMLCYEFGPFKLNADHRTLMRNGSPVSLRAKAADVLLVLLKNAGELVEKDALMAEVWPEAFVEESNLSQSIFTLRRALGDQRADAQYIETIAKRGYRFIASVKVVQLSTASENGKKTGEAERSPRLAVLPFINSSGDTKLEYLADGIGDNLINSLSQISRLRVMSRSSVFRYRSGDGDPKLIAKELGVDAILLGQIGSLPTGLVINVELVDAQNGWQLWGHTFECELSDIVEIQQEIVRQITASLKLTLTGDEEKRITARYTDNSEAYQAYLEGRFHWSRYTREGIEKGIQCFRKAIEFDPNYALAYIGIIDCYLRLATNYIPPEIAVNLHSLRKGNLENGPMQMLDDSFKISIEHKVKLRHEWDWRAAERELRRANDLGTDYPSAHQWHAVYLFVRSLYQDLSFNGNSKRNTFEANRDSLPTRIPSVDLSPCEEVQVLCTIAREQIDVGNYNGARLVLNRWWKWGLWPKSVGLDSKSQADLLFTVGVLAGFVASAEQLSLGQKHAEMLLSGSMALFAQLGSSLRSAEARNELALCYFRQGNFDLSRHTSQEVLDSLPHDSHELRGLALIRLAAVERVSGRLYDALARLTEGKGSSRASGPWITGRYNLELASTHKCIGISEEDNALFDKSLEHYGVALDEFEAIGHLRLIGIAENNIGFLLVILGKSDAAKPHLIRAGKMFEVLEDKFMMAQVHDTLARLHINEERYDLAEEEVNRAIETMEHGDWDAQFAEVLRTKGIIFCKLSRYSEAGRIFQRAHDIASRCGDREGAGLALLILFEEMSEALEGSEHEEIGNRLRILLTESQQSSVRVRVSRALELIEHVRDNEQKSKFGH